MTKKYIPHLIAIFLLWGLAGYIAPSHAQTQTNEGGTNFSSTTTFAENSGNTVSTTNVNNQSAGSVKTVPSVQAPSVVNSGQDSCLTGITGSANVLGFGVSGGTSVRDESCERLKHSARLQNLGYTDAALMVLLDQSGNEEALKVSNPDIFKKVVAQRLAYAKAKREALAKRGKSDSKLDDSIINLEIELEVATR